MGNMGSAQAHKAADLEKHMELSIVVRNLALIGKDRM